ncbi:MAG: nucleobase:cation symporter, family [Streptosporangiaceae bacterium]|jgi:NCS1 family nucleobase:cation symporter-1|nr:nucleobase:cation symporter, family [Streptosporangiaceae bacterium]
MADATDELKVFEGVRPTHTGDLALESQGIAPIPADSRYGGVHRMFTVWFTPNMELSGVFTGTLAVVFGLGFQLGLVAIIVGTIIGSLPVAILCTWGPRTGTAQVPLARLPFGKTIVLPGTVQWLSSIAWDALVGLFGGQAAQLLFHVPFWLGVAIVLVLEGAVSVYGYEFVHRLQLWGSAILLVLFVVLSVRIFQHHVVLPHNTLHGGALFGAFVLMVTVSLSAGISWATYASDYSRYMKPGSSKAAIFWLTLAGLTASYVWVETIGLAGASVLGNQTAAGVRTLMGGGFLGILALVAIVFGAIASNSMNDYTGSLAFQALGARVRRPIIAAVVAVLAFAAILWMNAGDTSGKFTNVLLFIGYWIAPFCAIVMIDWHYNKDKYTPHFLRTALNFGNLQNGWAALVAFVVGFGVMVPFMNTTLITWHPVADALDGADLAFYVGFVVAGILYYSLRKWVADPAPAQAAVPAVGVAGEAGSGRPEE